MVLTGIRQRAWGRLRYMGTPPFFLPCDTNISSIYGIVCPIVFVLCVLAYGVVLRSVCVLSYVMVEKVESLLRGHWSVFNIYRAFSFPPSRFCVSCWRPVAASRLLRLVVRLVSSSRCRLLIVASCYLVSFHPCVLLVADAVAISSVGRLMLVASRRERFVSLYLVYRVSHRGVSSRSSASCLVSSIASFSFVPFCSCRHPWRGGGSGGAWRGCPCHHVVRAIGVLFPYF